MAEHLDIKFQQRFSKNIISNVAYFILNFLIGILLVPFFIDSLGYAAYGLIPLATSVTSYVTMTINALNYAISRYLIIDLQRGDTSEANHTFNTALIGSLAIILLLIPVAIIISWFAPTFFSIGNTPWNDVFILFLLVFSSALIRTWSSNFIQTLFAYNRLDLRNFVEIINIIVQVGLIIFLFNFISQSLIWIGTAYFAAALISLLCSIYLSKKVAPNLHFNPKLFSRKRLTEISGIALWSLIGNVGCVLTSSIALIIANVLLGETAASDYSIALTINIGLIAVASLLTTTFTPMIYSYFAKGDTQGLVSFCKLAITSSGLVMALPIGLVCLFAPELLTLWLGQEYIYLIPLLWIVVISTLINVMEAPTSTIGVCYLRVRFQCISALLTGLLSLILAIILPSYWNLGIYGIAIAIVIGNWLHRCVLCPLYFSWLIDRSYLNFIPTMYKTTLYLLIILVPGGILLSYVAHTNMWTTIGLGLLICIIYILSIPRLVLKKKERMLIRTCIPSFISKIIPHWIF